MSLTNNNQKTILCNKYTLYFCYGNYILFFIKKLFLIDLDS